MSGTPLLPPPPERQAIRLSGAALERYVGRYQFSPTAEVLVIRRDERLFAKLPGRRAIEMFPESPTAFFLKIRDSQLTFNVDPEGQVTGLVSHQNGRDRPGDARRLILIAHRLALRGRLSDNRCDPGRP